MRRAAATLVAALTLAAVAPATAVGPLRRTEVVPPGGGDVELPAGILGSETGSSLLRGLRQLQTGTVPDGTILIGDPPPTPLAPGVSATLHVTDMDGDGIEELVQVRGTITSPKLALTDGGTGTPIWTKTMPTHAFAVRLVPDGEAQDLLLFMPGTIARLDGASGSQLWTSSYPSGDWIGYWGVSPTSSGGDIVVGAWSIPYPQILELRLEFRSLATGQTTGTLTVQGEGDFPTAALAGDLDGDGVGDVFTLAPLYTFSAASGGMVTAVAGRGATELWSAPMAVEVTDYTYLIDGADVTGDGRGDPVLLSEWLGADASQVVQQLVTVMDGTGGTTSGLSPVRRVTLEHIAQTFVSPGDINGDGAKDLILSGAVYNTTEGLGKVVFEAIGRSGRLWKAVTAYPASYSEFRWGWWPAAGDLDGDGIEDALVLLGKAGVGADRAVAVGQRGGGQLWQRDGLAGAFDAPLLADADGDGADDVLDRFLGDHPTPDTTRFRFTVARGRDLEPLWSHTRVVNSGYPSWTIYAGGGRLRPDADTDLIVEYNQGGPGRHAVDAFHGPTGTVRWTNP